MPEDVPLPPLWILGSTEDGAAIAASKGLGFAFAHHINPDSMLYAAQVYRERFRASRLLDRPVMILTIAAVCAETEAQTQRLAATTELAWLRLRTGQPAPLASPDEALAYPYTPIERQIVQAARRHFGAGDPASVRERVEGWVAKAGADEVMVTTMVYEPQARIRSYELLAEAFGHTAAAAV